MFISITNYILNFILSCLLLGPGPTDSVSIFSPRRDAHATPPLKSINSDSPKILFVK